MVAHKVDCLYLNGGEPLLHPDLTKIIYFCRECFPTGLIKIFTNGTLLLRQEENFWKACRDCKIILWITHYPISIQIDKIRQRARSYGVEVLWADFSGNKPKTMWKIPYHLGGGAEPGAVFPVMPSGKSMPAYTGRKAIPLWAFE